MSYVLSFVDWETKFCKMASLLSRNVTGIRCVSRRTTVVTRASVGRQELADRLASRVGITKVAAADTVNFLLDTIRDEVVKGNDVVIPGFGSWKRIKKESRTGRNPKTGEPLAIPEKFAPRFGFGQPFKDAVSGKITVAAKPPPPPKAPKKEATPKTGSPAPKTAPKAAVGPKAVATKAAAKAAPPAAKKK
ncbi:hypothetical protein CEUSTIGMA_g10125.t1 [Chlamydomonas eustigma]|uniref:HU family DNA-binding protein n=1 Tax=Chlamydomonas eustigma TaxID=1157962 RepID=A0A250XIF8_9CHLO|nr:hypothetical protein CEUSTIGMA_g10125.t1 [Chlamydomonas eustigma]|eukprot:GAX82699.1 hypothetical protein CEUSTIGMA_g10125.t1 [Chlamydomonas eustigma]